MQKLPKYIVIINYFKEQIEKEIIADQEALPLENEICQLFSASHMTVTKAMNELAATGYIKRTPGRGTFAISAFKTTIRKSILKSESITNLIENSGMKPRTELIQYLVVKGKDVPEVSSILKIDENEFLHYFIRARYGDDKLVCLSYTYVSQAIMPTIDIKQIEGSFNDYVKSLGIYRSYGYTEFSATLPTPSQAKLIKTEHVSLLKQTIMWNVNDIPFELTQHYYVGDKYTITQDLMLKYNDDGSFTKEAFEHETH